MERTPLLLSSASSKQTIPSPVLHTFPDQHDSPLHYRALALLCALFLAIGSHFAAHTLGALKVDLKENLGISNSEFGVLQSCVSMVNSFIPIVGGVLLDRFGTSSGSLTTTSLIATGSLITALATNLRSFQLMIVGRIMYGLGSGTIVIVQEIILCQWFSGKSLSFVFGIMISISRLASFLANLTVVPIKNYTGRYEYSFWFSAAICVICFLLNAAYILYIPSHSHGYRPISLKRRVNSFSLTGLRFLPFAFWLIIILEFLLGGLWTSILHNATEMVQFRFGSSQEIAAYEASVGQALPVMIAPFLGTWLDRYGGRIKALLLTAITLLVSQLLLGFASLTPIVGMFFFSISLSLGPVALTTSIPILLARKASLLGTAFGLIKAANNIGATICDICAGMLQDGTQGGKSYDRVFAAFIVLAGVATFVTLVLWGVDWRWGKSILEVDGKKAAMLLEDEAEVEEDAEWKGSRWNYVGIGLLAGLMVLSWYLFMKFTLKGIFS
ncbi:uncharacterized protein VTP21DRAFT_8180 [Calcarisporiella thermophila]|uniref:uncharacterized protein n=1 Tax=Calcarisporiella thermophila TaxID=911321 RepID=UPI00374360FA